MKKPIYKRWWFWLIVVCAAVSVGVSEFEEAIANPSVAMEVFWYAIIPILWGASMVIAAVCLLLLPIKKARKKDTQRTKQWLAGAFICVVATFIVICAYPTGEVVSNDDPVGSEVERTGNENQAADPADKEVDAIEVGSTKEKPLVITTDELAKEIEADIDAAKAKYNGKWIQITGKISDTSDGGVVYGYYIYGESSTTGYRGLKIICWCEDGPYSGSVMGDTKTFLGQILEVSTVNSTEIVDCEIVK